MKDEQGALDCRELATVETEITLDGRELMQIVNGLGLLSRLNDVLKNNNDSTCDDCVQATEEVYERLSKILDKAEEESKK